MALSIEVQYTTEACRHCGLTYEVARGPVFDGDAGVGLYLAGMHACEGKGTVVMAIAFLGDRGPEAFTVQAWPTPDEYQMVFRDGADSPWAHEDYLGAMLSAEDARKSPRRDEVFEVADLICGTIPRVEDFLNAEAESQGP